MTFAYVASTLSLMHLTWQVLFFKGFHALACHRVAHALWTRGSSAADEGVALLLQSRSSEVFGVDVHPGAAVGPGVMLDHATAIVIGGTAVVGSDNYILHQVPPWRDGRAARSVHPPTRPSIHRFR